MHRPLLVFFAIACLACQPQVGATFEPGVEHLPGPAYFHVEGDPATAGRALTVKSFGTDGASSGLGDDFVAGDVVRFDRTAFPGERSLAVNGVACTGRFTIEGDRETDVILRITDSGCQTIVQRIHDLGAVVHP